MLELQKAGIPLHHQPQKNWDLFHFLNIIRENIDKSENILDVGASGSPVLEALLNQNYSNLYGIDLRIGFREWFNRIFMTALHRRDFRILYGYSPIKLKGGNLCSSGYPDNYFSAVTSLSVIEHGVPFNDYFKEMNRILKPGGFLLTTTDYWHEKLETERFKVFGAPMKVFIPKEIKECLSIAFKFGFNEVPLVIPDCNEPCVTFNNFHYTFLFFLLQKKQ